MTVIGRGVSNSIVMSLFHVQTPKRCVGQGDLGITVTL